MTTKQAEAQYLAEHLAQWADKGYALHNPDCRPLAELPVIYGFNNGGSTGMLSGTLMAEDGTSLGGHGCSNEAYMLHDLGILEGSRPDRHETFMKHYPGGYRMEFVSSCDVTEHEGLMSAYRLNQEKRRIHFMKD